MKFEIMEIKVMKEFTSCDDCAIFLDDFKKAYGDDYQPKHADVRIIYNDYEVFDYCTSCLYRRLGTGTDIMMDTIETLIERKYEP